MNSIGSSLSDEIKRHYSGKNILITGGLGFIGSNLTRALVEFGSKVCIVDSMIPGYGGNLFNVDGISSKIQINYSDMRDGHSLEYLVKGKGKRRS